VTSLIPFICF